MEDLLTSAINRWSIPEATTFFVIMLQVVKQTPGSLGLKEITYDINNFFQDIRNLKSGRTSSLRAGFAELAEKVSPGIMKRIGSDGACPLLPINEGRVLRLLRERYGEWGSEEDYRTPLTILDNYLLMLAACDQDAVEQGLSRKRYFKDLIAEWRAEATWTFSKHFLKKTLHYDDSVPLKKVETEMGREWVGKRFQRLRNFNQEENWHLPPLMDFKRMFEAIFRLRLKRGSLPKEAEDYIPDFASVCVQQLVCFAGLDKLREKVSSQVFSARLERFVNEPPMLGGQNTLT